MVHNEQQVHFTVTIWQECLTTLWPWWSTVPTNTFLFLRSFPFCLFISFCSLFFCSFPLLPLTGKVKQEPSVYREGPPYQRRGSLQLWQFLVTLLDDPANGHFIAWTGRGMEFKLIEPEEVSTCFAQWGSYLLSSCCFFFCT